MTISFNNTAIAVLNEGTWRSLHSSSVTEPRLQPWELGSSRAVFYGLHHCVYLFSLPFRQYSLELE